MPGAEARGDGSRVMAELFCKTESAGDHGGDRTPAMRTCSTRGTAHCDVAGNFVTCTLPHVKIDLKSNSPYFR